MNRDQNSMHSPSGHTNHSLLSLPGMERNNVQSPIYNHNGYHNNTNNNNNNNRNQYVVSPNHQNIARSPSYSRHLNQI